MLLLRKLLTCVVLFLALSGNVYAFTCKDATGGTLNSAVNPGGSLDVYVNVTPQIEPGQNLVVDLSQSISCKNDDVNTFIDYVSFVDGSTFNGALNNFSGTMRFNNNSYVFPLRSSTSEIGVTASQFSPFPISLYLTPLNNASGVVISSRTQIARLAMHKEAYVISQGKRQDIINFYWNIYANNDVVIPVGGCDVSARNVAVTLPSYPASAQPVDLSVRCASNQNLAYYLTGTTTDSKNSIFTNTATNPAQGIGIQLYDKSGAVISTNTNIPLGVVTSGGTSLGLQASYALTGSPVTAGDVQSVISVTFVYQ